MAPPFIPWPGADGLLTTNMWAWHFPTRPAFLGPVPVREPDPPPSCEMVEEESFEMAGSLFRQVPLLGQDLTLKPTPPPCAQGYIPLLDRGVLKCVPGSIGGFSTQGASSQRTYPVKAGYGWQQV